MRWIRAAINAALAILLLFDVVLGVQIYVHGWPARVTLAGSSPGVERVEVSRLAFTGTDAWILAALVGAHVLVIYLAWRFRRRIVAL